MPCRCSSGCNCPCQQICVCLDPIRCRKCLSIRRERTEKRDRSPRDENITEIRNLQPPQHSDTVHASDNACTLSSTGGHTPSRFVKLLPSRSSQVQKRFNFSEPSGSHFKNTSGNFASRDSQAEYPVECIPLPPSSMNLSDSVETTEDESSSSLTLYSSTGSAITTSSSEKNKPNTQSAAPPIHHHFRDKSNVISWIDSTEAATSQSTTPCEAEYNETSGLSSVHSEDEDAIIWGHKNLKRRRRTNSTSDESGPYPPSTHESNSTIRESPDMSSDSSPDEAQTRGDNSNVGIGQSSHS